MNRGHLSDIERGKREAGIIAIFDAALANIQRKLCVEYCRYSTRGLESPRDLRSSCVIFRGLLLALRHLALRQSAYPPNREHLPITPFSVTLISVIWHLRKIPSFLARSSTMQISSTELTNLISSSETWEMARKCSYCLRGVSEKVPSSLWRSSN